LSLNRLKKPAPAVSPYRAAACAHSVVPSLPPAPADVTVPTATTSPRKSYALPPKSVQRRKIEAILAMKAAGYGNKEIAEELGIQPNSVWQYMWRAKQAAKEGGLRDPKTGLSLLANPAERVEFDLLGSVVDNFEQMLSGPSVPEILERGQRSTKMEATFKLADIALAPKFDAAKEAAVPSLNALKIEIVMPSTGMNSARAESMGGTPVSYVDAEVIKE